MRLDQLNAKLEVKKAELETLIEGAKGPNLSEPEQRHAEQIEREIRSIKRSISAMTTLDALESPSSVTDASSGMPRRELQRYSFMRALQRKAAGQQLDGIEREASDAIAKRSGKSPKGFYVPASVLVERALDIGTNGTGFQQTNTARGEYIDVLRNNTLTDKLGVTFLTNMVGIFQIPRQTGAGTAYWLAEGTSPTTSTQTSDQLQFMPKTVGAFTDVTRQFVNQTSVAAEQFVVGDLLRVVGQAVDLAAFTGTGSNNQPLGVLNNTDATVIALGTNGAALTWADAVNFETQLSIHNAAQGTMSYVTNNAVRGKLKTTQVATNYPTMVWGTDDKINGYSVLTSQQIPSNLTKGTADSVCSAMIFANWQDLIIAMWGTLDILVDPYTLSSSGGIRIVALQDADIQLRRPKSFVICKDILTA